MSDSVIEVCATALAVFLFILITSPLLGLFTMWTWNATMPAIFGLPAITWIQGICLNILSSLLIKSQSSGSPSK